MLHIRSPDKLIGVTGRIKRLSHIPRILTPQKSLIKWIFKSLYTSLYISDRLYTIRCFKNVLS